MGFITSMLNSRQQKYDTVSNLQDRLLRLADYQRQVELQRQQREQQQAAITLQYAEKDNTPDLWRRMDSNEMATVLANINAAREKLGIAPLEALEDPMADDFAASLASSQDFVRQGGDPTVATMLIETKFGKPYCENKNRTMLLPMAIQLQQQKKQKEAKQPAQAIQMPSVQTQPAEQAVEPPDYTKANKLLGTAGEVKEQPAIETAQSMQDIIYQQKLDTEVHPPMKSALIESLLASAKDDPLIAPPEKIPPKPDINTNMSFSESMASILSSSASEYTYNKRYEKWIKQYEMLLKMGGALSPEQTEPFYQEGVALGQFAPHYNEKGQLQQPPNFMNQLTNQQQIQKSTIDRLKAKDEAMIQFKRDDLEYKRQKAENDNKIKLATLQLKNMQFDQSVWRDNVDLKKFNTMMNFRYRVQDFNEYSEMNKEYWYNEEHMAKRRNEILNMSAWVADMRQFLNDKKRTQGLSRYNLNQIKSAVDAVETFVSGALSNERLFDTVYGESLGQIYDRNTPYIEPGQSQYTAPSITGVKGSQPAQKPSTKPANSPYQKKFNKHYNEKVRAYDGNTYTVSQIVEIARKQGVQDKDIYELLKYVYGVNLDD